jgi:hypothetical protein
MGARASGLMVSGGQPGTHGAAIDVDDDAVPAPDRCSDARVGARVGDGAVSVVDGNDGHHPALAVELDRQLARSIESEATAYRGWRRGLIHDARVAESGGCLRPRRLGQLSIRVPSGLDGVRPRRAADDLRQPE